jgi:hypothetical protein
VQSDASLVYPTVYPNPEGSNLQKCKNPINPCVYWCRVRGLNSRPTVYKTAALPLS